MRREGILAGMVAAALCVTTLSATQSVADTMSSPAKPNQLNPRRIDPEYQSGKPFGGVDRKVVLGDEILLRGLAPGSRKGQRGAIWAYSPDTDTSRLVFDPLSVGQRSPVWAFHVIGTAHGLAYFSIGGRVGSATGTYVTDGTRSGTHRLSPDEAHGLTEVGDEVVLGGSIRTDGTVAGTSKLTDAGAPFADGELFVMTVPAASYPSIDLVAYDGTGAEPTVLRTGGGYREYAGDIAVRIGDKYVIAWGTRGSQLWVTDGTPEGTEYLKPIPNYGGGAYPQAEGDRALYLDTGVLWSTDGTLAGTAKVLIDGAPTNGCRSLPIPFQGKLLGLNCAGAARAYSLAPGATTGTAIDAPAAQLGGPAALGEIVVATAANNDVIRWNTVQPIVDRPAHVKLLSPKRKVVSPATWPVIRVRVDSWPAMPDLARVTAWRGKKKLTHGLLDANAAAKLKIDPNDLRPGKNVITIRFDGAGVTTKAHRKVRILVRK